MGKFIINIKKEMIATFKRDVTFTNRKTKKRTFFPKNKQVVIHVDPETDRRLIIIDDETRIVAGIKSICNFKEIVIPTESELKRWMMDSMCESPLGTIIEHDGHDEKGFPSWISIIFCI